MKISNSAALLAYVCAAASSPLHVKRGTTYNGGTTANDVTNGLCAPLTFIFARGSTEAGTMGSTVGPALADQLIKNLGASQIAVQGVDYPATIQSNIYLGSQGGPVMASLAKKALSQCPSTKIVLSGYSQGAMVVHYALASAGLSGSTVAAIVVYGDPEDGTAFSGISASKVDEFCAAGDGVCETHSFDITAAHLSYVQSGDIQTGATFIQTATGVKKGSK